MTNPIIERDIDPVYVDSANGGQVELRIGTPLKQKFQPPSEWRGSALVWAVPEVLERGASLFVMLTPTEARIVAHSLLAAANMASS
jgi:hypothetical protein